jgi:predicted RNase H-like nuclease (RuvC/YqgF family)
MTEQNWPAIIGALGGFVGFAAVLKVIRDWQRDRGASRLSGEEQVRQALVNQNTELRHEVEALREELADARRELGRHIADSAKRLRACEERAVTFQRELAEVKGQLSALRGGTG